MEEGLTVVSTVLSDLIELLDSEVIRAFPLFRAEKEQDFNLIREFIFSLMLCFLYRITIPSFPLDLLVTTFTKTSCNTHKLMSNK